MLPVDRISAKGKLDRIAVGYLILVSDFDGNAWALARVLDVLGTTLRVSLITMLHVEDPNINRWSPGKDVAVGDNQVFFLCTVELAEIRGQNWWSTGHHPGNQWDETAPQAAYYTARYMMNESDAAARAAAIAHGAYAA